MFLFRTALITFCFVFVPALACADIFRWEWFDPINPSAGKYESTILCPDGAGVSAQPGVDLYNRNLTQAYLIGTNLHNADMRMAGLAFADLSGACLENADMNSARLSGANLSGAVLESAILYNAMLSNADLSGAQLKNARFGSAILSGTDFTGAVIKSAELYGVTSMGFTSTQLYSTASYQGYFLSGINLGNNNLTGWNFSHQDLTYASLDSSNLSNVDLSGAIIWEADLSNTNLTSTQLYSTASYQQKDLFKIKLCANDLSGWDLSEQNLNGASLCCSNLSYANLSGSRLVDAEISSSDLSHANLRGAHLDWVNLECSNLWGADLSWSCLYGSVLRGAYLYDTNFSNSFIEECDLSESTQSGFTVEQFYSTHSYKGHCLWGIRLDYNDLGCWDFSDQNLDSASFEFASLPSANFFDANLHGAVFSNADLNFTDFRGAQGFNSQDANLQNTIQPDGFVESLELRVGETFWIRDYNEDIDITIGGQVSISPQAAIRIILEDENWGSTICFEPGEDVILQGYLELTFAEGVDLESLVGVAFDLFDWENRNISGQFHIVSGLDWDISSLYTTGEVSLLSTEPNLPGDANLDGMVNHQDATIMADNWLQSGATWAMGDFNGDNIVDSADASILATNWQTSGSAQASVPEPSVLMLVFGAMMPLVWRRRT